MWVEIVQIKVTFNSFNKMAVTRHLKGNLKEKLFNLYFMFYMTNIIIKPRITVKRKIRRTFVVLKSPFHYKTPKHHIQYSYYAIYVCFTVASRFAHNAHKVVSSFFLQNKTNRVELRDSYRINYLDLV